MNISVQVSDELVEQINKKVEEKILEKLNNEKFINQLVDEKLAEIIDNYLEDYDIWDNEGAIKAIDEGIETQAKEFMKDKGKPLKAMIQDKITENLDELVGEVMSKLH